MEERKRGDLPGGNPLQADLYKLVVNSTYGGLIQNKDKHGQIKFVEDGWQVCQEINEPTFRDATVLAKGLVQLTTTKRKVKQNVPVQVGKFILDYAKMHMVNLYYHVLREYCDMSKIDLVSMDTDSFTLSLSEEDLDACVKPEKRKDWERSVRPHWFVHRGCKKVCPDPHCNKRTPGPFKNENYGEKVIALSSKLFTVTSTRPGEQPKVACKGLMKDRLHYDDSERFESTLYGAGDEALTVAMTSFQRKKGSMLSVATTRTVTNRYNKRKIDDRDNSRTLTLTDVIDCGMPAKRVRVFNEIKKVMRAKKRKLDECLPINAPLDPPPSSPPSQPPPSPPPSSPLTPPASPIPPALAARAETNRLAAQAIREEKEREATLRRMEKRKEKDRNIFNRTKEQYQRQWAQEDERELQNLLNNPFRQVTKEEIEQLQKDQLKRAADRRRDPFIKAYFGEYEDQRH